MTVAQAKRPVKVVVVDDSVLMRTMLRTALEVDGDIEVAGSAAEPYAARDLIKKVNPDVVTLDVEMPGMNGLEFLEKIMRLRPMPVVMVSSLTSEGADATLTALEFGAVDFAAKPAGNAGMREFGEMVRRKVREASRARIRTAPGGQRQRPTPQAMKRASGVGLIAIGASTGGVAALGSIVQRLPKGMPPTVAVVHMPENYTRRFAARLASQTGHDVAEAREGEVLRTGMIRIAPGSHHLEVVKSGAEYATRLNQNDLVSGHRPSVDVCFQSVASAAAGRALGVILTGMGRDGANGLLKMRQAGAICLGESESSCVVYGMPKAAREAGAVNEEFHLEKMPDRICELVSGQSYRA